jgi:hypothetical protein
VATTAARPIHRGAGSRSLEYDGNAAHARDAQGGATIDTAYEYNVVGNGKAVTTAAGVRSRRTPMTWPTADAEA